MTDISILIPSLKTRAAYLTRIESQLTTQINNAGASDRVRVITDVDNGKASIGEKRNRLVEAAGDSKYVAFVDDDDRVAFNYIQLLISAIKTDPDCCSLKGIVSFDGKRQKIFLHSTKYKGWYEDRGILYRYINHLNCVKTDIVRRIPFAHINHGEDADYSKRLMNAGLITSEAHIIPTLYFYDYRSKK